MTQTTVEGGVAIPEGLAHLPVAKQLKAIDLSQSAWIAKAATGSGKTMILPCYEAMQDKLRGEQGCIAMRIPTKVAGGFVTSGIKKFWEPLGLKVAILNRDVNEESAEGRKMLKAIPEADLVIISDGSLKRLMKLTKVRKYYCDEAHWLFLNAELDLAIAKKEGMGIRLLSATIDESRFVSYLGNGTPVYTLEGRAFPIRKHTIWMPPEVLKRDDAKLLYELIDDIIGELKAKNESALFFLPTRKMCEDAAEQFQKDISSYFVHGGVSPVDAEAWMKKHAGTPVLVFATTAAAASITLDIHRSYIADEIIESFVERGMERMQSGKMDDNMILQAAGRAGRIREGDAYLITHEDHRDPNGGDPWDYIKPQPVQPPAERATPYEVILAMAQHGITNDADIDLLSKLDQHELNDARDWLIRNNCLEMDGTLTKLGKLVASFPMQAKYAHLVLSAPSARARLALLAAFSLGLQGTYGLVKVKPRSTQLGAARYKDPRWPIYPADCLVRNSIPMSLAKTMQRILRFNGADEVYAWANANNIWAKSLFVARKDFVENAKFIISEGGKRALIATNFDDPALKAEVHEHLKRHSLYREVELNGATSRFAGLSAFFDAVFADAFGMEQGQYKNMPWRCWATPKKVVKPRFQFYGLEMGIVEPLFDQEPEPAPVRAPVVQKPVTESFSASSDYDHEGYETMNEEAPQ